MAIVVMSTISVINIIFIITSDALTDASTIVKNPPSLEFYNISPFPYKLNSTNIPLELLVSQTAFSYYYFGVRKRRVKKVLLYFLY